MKRHDLILSITLTLALGLSGCASIAKILPFGGDSDAPDLDDPIVAAALQLRRPASTPDATGGSDDLSGYRPAAPVASTISYGMGMDEVTSIWGQPSDIEAAGDARDGNQRWIYYSGLSSRYGLGSKRVVYFEAGKVAGWRN